VIPKARGYGGAAARGSGRAIKQRVIATAEGDASRFRQVNAEYVKSPEVTRSRLYLDTMQQVYANTSKVLVDSAKAQGNLLYLPLDKLMQAAGAVAASPAGGSPELPVAARTSPAISNEVPPQVVEKTEARSRETLRQRDREAR
jgi:membrane protease subunit HflK